VLAIERQARERDLHHEHRIVRVGCRVGAEVAADDRHVGFGFRGLVEGDGRLAADVPAFAEGPRKRALDELDCRVVSRALELSHDQQAVDQLDAVTRGEDALLDELLVLDSLPSLELDI
jgi:hypothetical protein